MQLPAIEARISLLVVVHVLEDALAGLARQHVVDVRLALLVDRHEDLVGLAEEVVQVAEHVLVGAHEAHAEVVGLAVLKRVERRASP